MNISTLVSSAIDHLSFQNTGILKRTILLLKTILLASLALPAQDIHYSQFYNAPLLLNPGLTGVFGGNTRFMANYRSQWASVPVDYQTFTAAVDHKFFGRRASNGFFSGGLAFNFDRAGYSQLTYVNLGLNGSYTRKLTNHFYATLGVQVGGTQRNFKLDDLTFDNQYDTNTGQVDFDLPTGESFNDKETNSYFDLSTGINFRWQALSDAELVDRLEKRSRLDFGIGLFHLNKPNQSFIQGIDSPLNMRFTPYVSGALQLGKSIDLLGVASVQFQEPYNESVLGLGTLLYLNRSLGKQIALQLGALVRFFEIADTFTPAIELHYNSWRVGFSYDVTVSEFNVATQRRSGPELSVQYIIKRVKPLPAFKICPLI